MVEGGTAAVVPLFLLLGFLLLGFLLLGLLLLGLLLLGLLLLGQGCTLAADSQGTTLTERLP